MELLWQAALAERASESYFSIRIADRATPERRRAMDEFIAREVEPDGIALFARSRRLSAAVSSKGCRCCSRS